MQEYFVTVIRKFKYPENTYFKFERLKLPVVIPGEGASEIIFCLNAKVSAFTIDGCEFQHSSHSLKGENITQNLSLGFIPL